MRKSREKHVVNETVSQRDKERQRETKRDKERATTCKESDERENQCWERGRATHRRERAIV